jgi:hypothetical protein
MASALMSSAQYGHFLKASAGVVADADSVASPGMNPTMSSANGPRSTPKANQPSPDLFFETATAQAAMPQTTHKRKISISTLLFSRAPTTLFADGQQKKLSDKR